MQVNSLKIEWMNLDKEQKTIKARISEINKRKEEIQEVVLDSWAEEGKSGENILGRYLYAHHELYVGPKKVVHPGTGKEVVPWPVVSQALRSCGYGDFVEERFDSRKLATVIREVVKDPDDELPTQIEEHFDIFEKRSLRSRKGKTIK